MTDPAGPSPGRASPLVWIAVGAALLGVVAFAAWRRASEETPVNGEPPATAGPEESDGPEKPVFELPPPGMLPAPVGPMPDVPAVERSGRKLTTADLRGRFTVMDLIFTNCGGPCPRLTAQMVRLQEALPKDDDLRLVSFTVDPERDTPEVLAKYAKDFGADPERWWFLRVEGADLRRIVGHAFHLMPEEDLFVHSNHFLLLDPEGRLRALYLPLQEEGWRERLLADLASLRKGS